MKKLLSFMLALLMCMALLPSVMAEEKDPDQVSNESQLTEGMTRDASSITWFWPTGSLNQQEVIGGIYC